MSPTSRSLKLLREQGYEAEVVEKFNFYTKRKSDLFNVIDIVAAGDGLLGVQATSRGNVSARVKKSLAEPRLKAWLKAGGRYEVWGWGKTGKAGERKKYTVRVVNITLADLEGVN